MTLDEAIKHAEEVAEREKEKGFEFNTRYNRENEYGTKCYECAEEHRQLAEWLKELKMYREMIPSASEVFISEIRKEKA